MVKTFMKLKFIGKLLVLIEIILLYLMYYHHNLAYIFPYLVVSGFNTWSFFKSNSESHAKETGIFMGIQLVILMIVASTVEYLSS